jgi:hypothetical protein
MIEGFKDDSRIEHDLLFSFGDIVHDRHKARWIFIGWRHNTAGAFPVFVKEQMGEIAIGSWAVNSVNFYNCSFTNTLLKKFPDAERFKKDRNDG